MGQDSCGALTDVEKCFNFLPRTPIMYMARRLGIPHSVLQAWSSFLRQMHRSFTIRQHIGQPIFSDSGLPEGDSLSCIGMIVANFCFHHYMAHYRPTLQAISFVDNLQILGDNPQQILMGYATMETWAELLHLNLDKPKTFFWSSNPQHRALFRSLGLSVHEVEQDLGATMQYGARHLNSPMQKRILSLKPYWSKLRSLDISPWHKILAVRVALLPRALHGVAQVEIGAHWIQKLRSGVMSGLGYNRAGASPVIRLAMICPIETDPGYFAALSTLREFYTQMRGCTSLQLLWRDYVQHEHRRTHGPMATMQNLMATVSWFLDASLVLHIPGGAQLSFLEVDFALLRFLLEYFWRQHLAAQVTHRKTMCDLDGIDHAASFASRADLDRDASELLNCVRDGTFYLNKIKAKYDAHFDGNCTYCALGLPDTVSHRALECPYFQSVREKFPEMTTSWMDLPISCTHHGLIPKNPWQLEYWQLLSELSGHSVTWQSSPSGGGCQSIFTDGSCLHPGDPHMALAGWYCHNADSEQPIAAGILPSIRQTINRAELWAIMMAVRWGLHFVVDLHLFTDSQYVYDGCLSLERLQHVPEDWDNLDLWMLYWDQRRRFSGALAFTKVKAHLRPSPHETEQEAWLRHWNHAADVGAKAIVSHGGPPRLHKIHEQLCNTAAQHGALARRAQDFLLALAQHSFKRENIPEELTEEDFNLGNFEECQLNECDLIDIFPIDYKAALTSSSEITAFGVDFAESLTKWFFELDSTADFVAPITVLELYFGLVIATKVLLPVRVGVDGDDCWRDLRTVRAGELMARTLASQLRVFEFLLLSVFDVFQYSPEWTRINRPGSGVVMQMTALTFPWPQRIAARVHEELLQFTCRRLIRSSGDLSRPWR